MLRSHRLLTSEHLQSSYVSLRLARLLAGLFLIAHWFGSIFFGISRFQDVASTAEFQPWIVGFVDTQDLSTQYVVRCSQLSTSRKLDANPCCCP